PHRDRAANSTLTAAPGNDRYSILNSHLITPLDGAEALIPPWPWLIAPLRITGGQSQHPSLQIPNRPLWQATGSKLWQRFTVHYTPPPTAVGSTRRRLKSSCSRSIASAVAESPTSRPRAAKPAPGLAASIAPAPGSTGASTAGLRAASSVM